jgi:hypothetical protein
METAAWAQMNWMWRKGQRQWEKDRRVHRPQQHVLATQTLHALQSEIQIRTRRRPLM